MCGSNHRNFMLEKVVSNMIGLATQKFAPVPLIDEEAEIVEWKKTLTTASKFKEKEEKELRLQIGSANSKAIEENQRRAQAMATVIRENAEILLMYAPSSAIDAYNEINRLSRLLSNTKNEDKNLIGEIAKQWNKQLCVLLIAIRKEIDGVELSEESVLKVIYTGDN